MNTGQQLSGRRVLVTGGTSGIGEAIARRFARAGAHVTITGRDQARGKKVVAALREQGGKAEFIAADLRTTSGVAKLAGQVGEVDVLVNNAGIYPFAPTDKVTTEEFDDVYAVNVRAPFFLTAALAPKMAAKGRGSIVNITTVFADIGMPAMAAYGSSKAALTQLTRVWAAEFGPAGVRVNAVSPGPTRTPGTEPIAEARDELAAKLPLGRSADPDEIASAVEFLASDDASYVNGAVLAVDGGRTAV